MDIKRWTGYEKAYKLNKCRKQKGDAIMENVIALDNYKTETECEWDAIANIFNKAIRRKGLNSKQVEDISKKILDEVRNKCE
ncbi:hypothetical protein ACY1J9_001216 [Clostridium botulinum]